MDPERTSLRLITGEGDDSPTEIAKTEIVHEAVRGYIMPKVVEMSTWKHIEGLTSLPGNPFYDDDPKEAA